MALSRLSIREFLSSLNDYGVIQESGNIKNIFLKL